MSLTDLSDHELLETARNVDVVKTDMRDLVVELAGRFAEALEELDKSDEIIADQYDALGKCAVDLGVLSAVNDSLQQVLAGRKPN